MAFLTDNTTDFCINLAFLSNFCPCEWHGDSLQHCRWLDVRARSWSRLQHDNCGAMLSVIRGLVFLLVCFSKHLRLAGITSFIVCSQFAMWWTCEGLEIITESQNENVAFFSLLKSCCTFFTFSFTLTPLKRNVFTFWHVAVTHFHIGFYVREQQKGEYIIDLQSGEAGETAIMILENQFVHLTVL